MTRPTPPAARALLIAALLLAGGPALAQETRYEITLTAPGAPDGLRDILREASRLYTLRDQPPPSPIGLRRRADADRERLAAALRSEGYFDATMDLQVDTTVTPAKVAVTITPGPRYRVKAVNVIAADNQPLPGGPLPLSEMGLRPGDPARGPDILSAQDAVAPILARRSHAYARVTDRRLRVDHADRSMEVNFIVDPGPAVTVGEIAVQGLDRVSEAAVRRRLEIETGDRFDPDKLRQARLDLTDLGVFSAVRLRIGEEPTADNAAPISVDVTERDMRFIGFGVNYATDEGFGANAYWGHRNLFGGAERLRISGEIAGVGRSSFADVSEFDYRLGAFYQEPDWLRRAQTLSLSAQAVSERPDAFRRDALILTAAVERELWSGIIGSLGVAVEQSRVEEAVQTTDNTLVSIPAALTVERTNDILNPVRGWRASLAVTPYWAALGDSQSFTVSRLGASGYWAVDEAERFVIAGRAVVGSAVGVGGLLDIPADKRFYAGGGGSIRGYAFQEVGPIGIDGQPLGGRSLIEVSAELRWQVSDSIGIVPFIDGGNVFVTEYPSFNEELRWGAGIGLRYFTGIGPLRLDVAVPLNPRPRDASWQLYISIGQAF